MMSICNEEYTFAMDSVDWYDYFSVIDPNVFIVYRPLKSVISHNCENKLLY